MTLVRALDSTHDWMFGKGLNDYRTNIDAVEQNINTNLLMFLGDCFFAITEGIDWWNLLGGKNELAINLAVNTAILNTQGVTGILQTNITLNAARQLQVTYQVQTVYSVLQSSFTYDIGTAA